MRLLTLGYYVPYIKKDRREGLLAGYDIETPGELNFLITTLCKDYLDQRGLSYQTINNVIGALEGAKLEFYRRVAVPFEEDAITRNGDIY